LLKSFFDGIPRDLYDAAQLDGAGPLRFLTHILLPLSGPVLTTITIFTFTAVWNDFAGPLILLPTSERQTIALGLYRMFADGDLGWNVQLAAAVLVALPPVLIVALLQRFITRGITMTGLQM
jgi:ABC-type glycerol-3-phosphate transport system permease component